MNISEDILLLPSSRSGIYVSDRGAGGKKVAKRMMNEEKAEIA